MVILYERSGTAAWLAKLPNRRRGDGYFFIGYGMTKLEALVELTFVLGYTGSRQHDHYYDEE